MERSCGDPTWDRDGSDPPGAASCLRPSSLLSPCLTQTHLQDPSAPRSRLPRLPDPHSEGRAPAPTAQLQLEEPRPKGHPSALGILLLLKGSGALPLPALQTLQGLPHSHSSHAELSVEQPRGPSFPPAGDAATARLLQSRGGGRGRHLGGRGRIREGQNPPWDTWNYNLGQENAGEWKCSWALCR